MEAEKILGAVVEREPRAHAAWHLLAVGALRSGAAAVAVERARRALDLDRRNLDYLNTLGIAYGEMGEFKEAESAFRRALTLRAANPQALYNLGKVLHKQDKLADALRAYERAYAIDPEFAGLRRNLAQLCQLSGRADRAVATLREAKAIDEAFASTYAACLADLEGDESAIRWLSRVIGEQPAWSGLRFERGLKQLALGRWRDGWLDYSARPGVAAERSMPAAKDLEGARVLLIAEQGLGDILFFLRFVGPLRALGAQVTLHCPPQLLGVLRGCRLVDELVDEREPTDPPRFQHSLWLGDLPQLLGVQDPPPAVPLGCDAAERQRASARLAALGPAPYLGLTWRAGTDVVRGPEFGARSDALAKEVPLEQLAAAVSGWPGTLLALQRMPRRSEIERLGALANKPVHDLSTLNDDLVAMTATLAVVDRYVAVSNTNIHLRAGLGLSADVLVPQPAEWRWMSTGERSPWFPDMRIYRQPVSRDWNEPLTRLNAELMK